MSFLVRGQTCKTTIIGLTLGTIAAILIVLIGQAHARPLIVCNQLGCSDNPNVRPHKNKRSHQFSARRHPETHSANTVIIGGRPKGCPRAYCGCGLAKYLGLSDRRLNLADNWRRLFPRTHARSGAVAVRNYKRRGYGHVMLLKRHIRNNLWLVRDYNSGGGLSRIHVRSVNGYSFVDPGSSRVAMNDHQ